MSNLYVCSELVNGVCQTWVVQASIIPPLSVSEGLNLGWKVVACYAAAWGVGLVTRFILSHERN